MAAAAKIISFINLKGGVGKTTLALTVGELLSYNYSGPFKVLMVDMDSQNNLSYALISEDELERLWREGKSTYHLFRQPLRGEAVEIKRAISVEWGNITRRDDTCLHVVVSSPDLAQFDEELLGMLEQGKTYPSDLRLMLKQALESLRNDYDYIIIDCPPEHVYSDLECHPGQRLLCGSYRAGKALYLGP